MALVIGTENADSGMSHLIYNELDRLLAPPLQKAIDDAEGDARSKTQEALDEARKSWQKLSFAIAKGVIEHLETYLEIIDIKTKGDVSTTIQGNTAAGGTDGHMHHVDLKGTQVDIVFTQSGDGIGHVRKAP